MTIASVGQETMQALNTMVETYAIRLTLCNLCFRKLELAYSLFSLKSSVCFQEMKQPLMSVQDLA